MLTEQNIEAELSYAYLHAVASKAGFSCEYRNRHLDGAGVDATITEDGRKLAPDSILTSFSVYVQLKATYTELPEQAGKLSYVLTVPHYDKLRTETVERNGCSSYCGSRLRLQNGSRSRRTALVAKRCAYWVSLRGADASANAANQTVYIPRRNLLSPAGTHRVDAASHGGR